MNDKNLCEKVRRWRSLEFKTSKKTKISRISVICASRFDSSLFTLHSSLFILHFSLFTLHSKRFFTLHSSLFTLLLAPIVVPDVVATIALLLHVHSIGFSISHAENIRLKYVHLETIHPDERPAYHFENTRDISTSSITPQNPE